MSWINEIKEKSTKIYSQCWEEGFSDFILTNISSEVNNSQKILRYN